MIISESDAAGEDETVTYKVTGSVDNGTFTYNYNETNQTVTITIRPASGYAAPRTDDSITVKVGNSAVSDWTYSGVTLTVYNVTGDVWFSCDCVKTATVMVRITLDGSSSDTGIGTATAGSSFTGTLPNRTGYDYPSSVSVTIDNRTISSSYYTYNSSTGRITINANAIPSDVSSIRINATYVAERYSVSGTITNGEMTYSGTPTYDQAFTITIVPNDGYDYPSSVTVKNGSSSTAYTYNSNTGVITISDVRGAITVTATCGAGQYSIIYHDGNTTLMLYPNTYTFGVGCILPTDVQKKDFIFIKWTDEDGNDIDRIPTDVFGDFHVYANFRDDLSSIDVNAELIPLYLTIALSVLAIIGIAYYSRK